ncbi:hypothetical protein KIP68_02275 [Corynebacterium aquatimens]
MPETSAVEPHDAPETAAQVEPLLNEANLDKATVTQTAPKPAAAPKGHSVKVETKSKAEKAADEAKDKAEDVAAEAKASAEEAKDKAKDAAAEAKDKAEEVTDDVKDAAAEAKDKAKDAAADAKERAEDVAAEAKASAEEAKDKAEDVAAEAKAKAEDVADDVKDAAAEAKDKAKDAAADAKEKAEDVAAEVKDKAEDVAAEAKAAAATASEKVKDAAAEVKDKAEEIVDKAKAKIAEATDDSGDDSDDKRAPFVAATPQFQTLKAIPNLQDINRRIFLGALPGVGNTPSAKADPTSALEVRGVTVDKKNLADYTSATGLRLANEVPPTYFFVLSFPLIMELMTKPDFPYAAMGSVHIANEIEQTRFITVDETLNVRTWPENLRPHRKGLLLDMITEITPEGESEPVWRQKSTMLGQGARFAKNAPLALTTRGEDTGKVLPKPELPEFKANAQWRWTRDNVRAYVKASNDHNPIHTSNIGAKLFGFPSVIAHGMYSAASVLAPLEGKLPSALRYRVEFVKPVLIPAKVSLWTIDEAAEGEGQKWDIQLRKSSKPETLHLNAELKAL